MSSKHNDIFQQCQRAYIAYNLLNINNKLALSGVKTLQLAASRGGRIFTLKYFDKLCLFFC
jgi:hypothetical protein